MLHSYEITTKSYPMTIFVTSFDLTNYREARKLDGSTCDFQQTLTALTESFSPTKISQKGKK